MPDQASSQEPSNGRGLTAAIGSWLQAAWQDAPIGIAIKSPDGRYLWVNPTAARLLGVSVERLQGAADDALFPPGLAERLQCGDAQALTRRVPVEDVVELASNSVQTAQNCRVLKYPLGSFNAPAEAIGVLLLQQSAENGDISALRQALGTLEQTNRELRSALDELEYLASTDKLTGAWNRRRLEEAAGDEINRLERYGHPVSALMLDIDHFKSINDTHGHAIGDRVLVRLAATLRGSFRRSDSLSRWGGEEFIVLCPHTGLSMATLLAERLRKSIALESFPQCGRITVSIGVAECRLGESWEQWFRRADEALMRAKRNGRNRVAAAPETMLAESGVAPKAGRFLQLTWRSAAYTSGHPLIDRQHRLLFDQSNRLLAAVLEVQSAEEIEAAFEDLTAEVQDHFRDEEAILRSCGYPAVDAHAVMHRELVDSAAALLEKFRAGLLGVGELFEFLARDVIAKHLLGADRDFFPYVDSRTGPPPDRRT